MTVILILLGAILGVGAVLYLTHRPDDAESRDQARQASGTDEEADGEVCCGMHSVCERDSLLASVSEKIEYFDDHELDRHAGRVPAEYNNAEVEEFRDILLTLLPEDVAPWARSLQLRGIALPDSVRDELLMIVSESRRHD